MEITPGSRKKLNRFFRKGTLIKYKKNEIILRPEDKPLGVHLIVSGYIKSYSISKTGQVSVRVIKTKNDIFPIVWALEGKMREIYMETMSDATLYRVSKSDFLKFIDSNPDVLRCLLREMVDLYSTYDIRIGNLEYRYAYDRIVSHLLFLAEHFGKKKIRGIYIDVPITHQYIADSINATRETVSRELAKLERKGLVWYKGRAIIIKSKADLEKEL